MNIPFQCDYEWRDDAFRCKNCGHVYRGNRDAGPPVHDCLRSPELVPILSDLGLSTDLASADLNAAILRWHLLGRPVRSDSDVAQLQAACQSCEAKHCRVRANPGLLRLTTWTCPGKASQSTVPVSSPELTEAAAKLGLTEWPQALSPLLQQWLAIGCPARSDEAVAAILATPCDGRRADGICNDCGCNAGQKTVRCEWLARMDQVGHCVRGVFGDRTAAIRAEIAGAMA